LKIDLEVIIFNEYGQPGFEEKTRSLDDLQIKVIFELINKMANYFVIYISYLKLKKLKCCGASNFLDWKDSNYVRNANKTSTDSLKTDIHFNLVAESCCKTPSKLCGKRTHPSNINYYVIDSFIKILEIKCLLFLRLKGLRGSFRNIYQKSYYTTWYSRRWVVFIKLNWNFVNNDFVTTHQSTKTIRICENDRKLDE
jgi:hypothetical protein